MRLPGRFLTTVATVLDQTTGTPDGLGQSVSGWAARPAVVAAASFPAGERVLRQAQLRGVKAQREVYLQGSVNLNPQRNRLHLDGEDWHVTLSNEWDGFTVAAIVNVRSSVDPFTPDSGFY